MFGRQQESHGFNRGSVKLEISNGWQKIFWYRRFLRENGFTFIKRSYGKSYYQKKCKTTEECNTYKDFCRRHGLKCQIYEKEYMRSSDYRKVFFENQNYARKYTLCAYCGFPVKVEKLTVDHIIPVIKAKKTKSCRAAMKLWKITDINEFRNLCGACKSCNSKKGSKMGIWIIRGFIGKNQVFWFIRWGFRILFFICMVCFTLNLLC